MFQQARALADLALRRYDALITLYERHGPVFRLGTGRAGYVYLLGPDANRFVFGNQHLFRNREAFESLVPVNGETSLIVSDGEDHRRRRALVRPALHHRQIDRYVRTMAENADRVLDGWADGERVDVYAEFRAAIRRSTIEALFGRRLAADARLVGDGLQPMLEMIDRMPQALRAHRRLRTPAWRRAMAARRVADARVFAEIDRLRRGAADEDDHVLATLVHGRNEEGSGLGDVEVRDQAINLIAAGYDTTSAAMAWAVHALMTEDGVWERAAAEVAAAGPPTAEALRRMPYLDGVVHETLRLRPPGPVSARKVAADFEFAGHRVRAGSMVIYSPYVTHRLPEVWPEPLAFRPERWTDGPRPGPHEFVPFGGGPHRCIGSAMATTELTVMLARLLARATLRPDRRDPRPTGLTAMRPRGGLPATVTSLAPREPAAV
ncbi:cytochrome P450 [Actinomadura sediminis]|uniref:Cytochrome P450 n=1 Tax=Actinomadura sediminis TaxID=1038904 RepID=A0ABW3EPT7_9ACTN